MRRSIVRGGVAAAVAVVAAGIAIGAGATSPPAGDSLPPLVRQPTPAAVVAEHVSALNACDWKRLMAQYPRRAEIHLPGGNVVIGRKAIGELFAGFVKPPEEGGLCGITFTAQHTFRVDGTLNVQWEATAPFLLEPYKGSDAYVTKNGLMFAMVSTFDGAELKMR
jgi:hypothetical protein